MTNEHRKIYIAFEEAIRDLLRRSLRKPSELNIIRDELQSWGSVKDKYGESNTTQIVLSQVFDECVKEYKKTRKFRVVGMDELMSLRSKGTKLGKISIYNHTDILVREKILVVKKSEKGIWKDYDYSTMKDDETPFFKSDGRPKDMLNRGVTLDLMWKELVEQHANGSDEISIRDIGRLIGAGAFAKICLGLVTIPPCNSLFDTNRSGVADLVPLITMGSIASRNNDIIDIDNNPPQDAVTCYVGDGSRLRLLRDAEIERNDKYKLIISDNGQILTLRHDALIGLRNIIRMKNSLFTGQSLNINGGVSY
jgi:hypothetical protein